MENFIVSARKYRPSTFNSVVGQASITTTLKNAIKNNHLAHAYLFCGGRGVGKTTCARIFAKTINCSAVTADFEPCNQCESCKSFNDNRSFNIHELDAASNNSVDDIRLLIDKVRVPPQLGSYSVYIIDEVHMLSQAAFNAFLKTLEEPPKHAIFILATTEKHKILPTILSRCQIFDFKRITVNDASSHIKYVATQEGITVEEEGINIIAQKADGAMRDALSIFDQIVSFSGNKITYQDVIQNLNVLDYDYYFKIVDAFLEENVTQALLVFNEVIYKGFDAHNFINGLSGHLRDILVCKDAQTIPLMEVGASIAEKYKSQAQRSDIDFIYDALNITNECDLSFKNAKNKRIHVELALFKLSRIFTEKKKLELKARREAKQNAVAQPVTASTSTNTTTAPKKTLEVKTTASVGSISIKSILSQPKKVVDPEQPTDSPTLFAADENVKVYNPYTNDDFYLALSSYLASIQNSNVRLYSILMADKPIIGADHKIVVNVLNNLQEKEVMDSRSSILSFIRKKLQNFSIDLVVTISQSEQKVVKAFTAVEKLAAMKNKNPEFEEFCKTFELDLY